MIPYAVACNEMKDRVENSSIFADPFNFLGYLLSDNTSYNKIYVKVHILHDAGVKFTIESDRLMSENLLVIKGDRRRINMLLRLPFVHYLLIPNPNPGTELENMGSKIPVGADLMIPFTAYNDVFVNTVDISGELVFSKQSIDEEYPDGCYYFYDDGRKIMRYQYGVAYFDKFKANTQNIVMGLTELADKSSFDAALDAAGQELVVIDFYATWCKPCKVLAPKLEELAAEKTNVHFYKINVEVNEEVTAKYGISAMPTILFFKNKKEVDKVIGANYSKITAAVSKHS